MSSGTTKRRWRWLVALVTPALLLIAAEAFLRTVDLNPPTNVAKLVGRIPTDDAPHPPPPESATPPIPSKQQKLEAPKPLSINSFLTPNDPLAADIWAQPAVAYLPHVSLEVTYRDGVAQFATNQFGFRDDETVVPKPKELVRIICIGGSVTVEGTANHLTYPAYLEEILRDRCDSDRIEVINCGVAGIRAADQLARVEDYLSLEPDLVLEHGDVSDLFAALASTEESSAVVRLLEYSKLFTSLFPRRAPEKDVFARPLEKTRLGPLTELRDQFAASGAKFIVINLPRPLWSELLPGELSLLDHYLQAEWSESLDYRSYCDAADLYNSLLASHTNRRGIPLISVFPELSGGLETFRDVCHTTDYGGAKKAETIAEQLFDTVTARLKENADMGRSNIQSSSE